MKLILLSLCMLAGSCATLSLETDNRYGKFKGSYELPSGFAK